MSWLQGNILPFASTESKCSLWGLKSMSAIAPSVLVDDSGRRRRALRRAGRAVSVLLLIWLAVLALAWLGIEPLGNLDFVDPVVGRVSPTALPAHIESAVTAGRVLASPARPSAPLAVGGRRSEPSGARAGGDIGPHRNTSNGKRLNATPIHNLPVPASSSAPAGTAHSSIPAQPPAGAGAGTQKGTESRQTTGSSNPGKSQSSPGQAKRSTTTPSTGSGKAATSPGHTKEPGQASAEPAPPSQVSTNADRSTIPNGHNKATVTTLPP